MRIGRLLLVVAAAYVALPASAGAGEAGQGPSVRDPLAALFGGEEDDTFRAQAYEDDRGSRLQQEDAFDVDDSSAMMSRSDSLRALLDGLSRQGKREAEKPSGNSETGAIEGNIGEVDPSIFESAEEPLEETPDSPTVEPPQFKTDSVFGREDRDSFFRDSGRSDSPTNAHAKSRRSKQLKSKSSLSRFRREASRKSSKWPTSSKTQSVESSNCTVVKIMGSGTLGFDGDYYVRDPMLLFQSTVHNLTQKIEKSKRFWVITKAQSGLEPSVIAMMPYNKETRVPQYPDSNFEEESFNGWSVNTDQKSGGLLSLYTSMKPSPHIISFCGSGPTQREGGKENTAEQNSELGHTTSQGSQNRTAGEPSIETGKTHKKNESRAYSQVEKETKSSEAVPEPLRNGETSAFEEESIELEPRNSSASKSLDVQTKNKLAAKISQPIDTKMDRYNESTKQLNQEDTELDLKKYSEPKNKDAFSVIAESDLADVIDANKEEKVLRSVGELEQDVSGENIEGNSELWSTDTAATEEKKSAGVLNHQGKHGLREIKDPSIKNLLDPLEASPRRMERRMKRRYPENPPPSIGLRIRLKNQLSSDGKEADSAGIGNEIGQMLTAIFRSSNFRVGSVRVEKVPAKGGSSGNPNHLSSDSLDVEATVVFDGDSYPTASEVTGMLKQWNPKDLDPIHVEVTRHPDTSGKDTPLDLENGIGLKGFGADILRGEAVGAKQGVPGEFPLMMPGQEGGMPGTALVWITLGVSMTFLCCASALIVCATMGQRTGAQSYRSGGDLHQFQQSSSQNNTSKWRSDSAGMGTSDIELAEYSFGGSMKPRKRRYANRENTPAPAVVLLDTPASPAQQPPRSAEALQFEKLESVPILMASTSTSKPSDPANPTVSRPRARTNPVPSSSKEMESKKRAQTFEKLWEGGSLQELRTTVTAGQLPKVSVICRALKRAGFSVVASGQLKGLCKIYCMEDTGGGTDDSFVLFEIQEGPKGVLKILVKSRKEETRDASLSRLRQAMLGYVVR